MAKNEGRRPLGTFGVRRLGAAIDRAALAAPWSLKFNASRGSQNKAASSRRTRVPGMGVNYQNERSLTELTAATVAERQGKNREGKLKEAEGKPTTAGTRTD